MPNKRFPPNARHSKKICRHCKVLFDPCSINGDTQEYCTEEECQSASKKKSQAKWVAKNPDYWKERWKLKKRLGLDKDTSPKPKVTETSSSVSDEQNASDDGQELNQRDLALENRALQDSIKLVEAQHVALMGALYMVLGDGVQEIIDGGGSLFRKCYGIGRRAGVASLSETLNRLETCDGIESHFSGEDPESSGSVQLGGSAFCARGSP